MNSLMFGMFVVFISAPSAWAESKTLSGLDFLRVLNSDQSELSYVGFFPEGIEGIGNKISLEYYKRKKVERLLKFARKNKDNPEWETESYFFQAVALYQLGKNDSALKAIRISLMNKETSAGQKLKVLIANRIPHAEALDRYVMREVIQFGFI